MKDVAGLAGWQNKSTRYNNLFLDRHAEYFTSAKAAMEGMEQSEGYSKAEMEVMRSKAATEEATPSLDEKYNWKTCESLPVGWKIRRSRFRTGKMKEFFLSTDKKHLRGRKAAIKHLRSCGGTEEEASKIQFFSEFKSRQLMKTVKKIENTENIVTEFDFSPSSSTLLSLEEDRDETVSSSTPVEETEKISSLFSDLSSDNLKNFTEEDFVKIKLKFEYLERFRKRPKIV